MGYTAWRLFSFKNLSKNSQVCLNKRSQINTVRLDQNCVRTKNLN